MTQALSTRGLVHFRKVLANIAWIFVERVWKIALGLIVFLFLARQLGPKAYGHLSLALALFSLFAALGGFGLSNVVIRRLVSNPTFSSITLGSATAVLLGSFTFSLLAMVLYVGFLTFNDPTTQLLSIVIAMSLLFRPSDVFRMWFEAHLQLRGVATVEIPVSMLFATLKIGLAIASAPLVAFAIAFTAEGLFLALGLLSLYEITASNRRDAAAPRIRKWTAHKSEIKTLLTDAWPLMFSAVAVIIYMRIDQVMIGTLLGPRDVGIYSAAVKMSESWYFIIVAIVTSLFPSIIVMKDNGSQKYQEFMRTLYGAIFALTVVFALMGMVFSEPLVGLALGSEYLSSAPILTIHIWTGVFVASGFLSSRQLIAEKLEKIVLLRTLLGCAVNIALNCAFIPTLGVIGAALATLASQAVASVFVTSAFHRSRPIFMDQMAALLLHKYMKPSRIGVLTAEVEYQFARTP